MMGGISSFAREGAPFTVDIACLALEQAGYRALLKRLSPNTVQIHSGAGGVSWSISFAQTEGRGSFEMLSFDAFLENEFAYPDQYILSILHEGCLVSTTLLSEDGRVHVRARLHMTQAEMSLAIFERHYLYWLGDLERVANILASVRN